jgi:transposase
MPGSRVTWGSTRERCASGGAGSRSCAWRACGTCPGAGGRDPDFGAKAREAVDSGPRGRVHATLPAAAGRPMVHDLRAMCDAVSYVVKNGVEWRALPPDFPPWEAVYAFFERWNSRGLPHELVRRLRELLRVHQGRSAEPTACIVDSQIIKCADTVGKATSGYHGGKKITGRGRHLAVDREGWLLALVVTAANVSDKAGAKVLAIRLFDMFSTLAVMWADSGYNGKPLAAYMKSVAAITLEVVTRAARPSFQVVRRRWASSAPSAG